MQQDEGAECLSVRAVFTNLILSLRTLGHLQPLLSSFFPKFKDGRAPVGDSAFPSPSGVGSTSQTGLRKGKGSQFPEVFG